MINTELNKNSHYGEHSTCDTQNTAQYNTIKREYALNS